VVLRYAEEIAGIRLATGADPDPSRVFFPTDARVTGPAMRVVIVGATRNVGSSLVRLLADDERVASVLGVARRRPALELPKTGWAQADVARDDLAGLFDGADAVVQLAWAIQPSHDRAALRRVNVEGCARTFDAVARAGVGALIFASSVGAYAPGPKDRRVDETWPATGAETSFYSRHKAEVVRRLDAFEHEHPDVRVVRLRPGLIFKRSAATGIRRCSSAPSPPASCSGRASRRSCPPSTGSASRP
jgi:UDP-glucose 4-epimerase